MDEQNFATPADAWRAELEVAAMTCATFFARRVPHWISVGSGIWGAQMSDSPLIGQSLPDELMFRARREIELRGEFARKALGEFAAKSVHVPATQVLVDCMALASDLVHRGCRDVARDIEHASQFLYGIDSTCADRALKDALARITDHLLDVIEQRPDYIAY